MHNTHPVARKLRNKVLRERLWNDMVGSPVRTNHAQGTSRKPISRVDIKTPNACPLQGMAGYAVGKIVLSLARKDTGVNTLSRPVGFLIFPRAGNAARQSLKDRRQAAKFRRVGVFVAVSARLAAWQA